MILLDFSIFRFILFLGLLKTKVFLSTFIVKVKETLMCHCVDPICSRVTWQFLIYFLHEGPQKTFAKRENGNNIMI
jgi:hypothetical protein